MAKRYLRTDKDFVVESIAGLKDIVQRHTVAGFEHIPDSIINRRFFQLLKFLQNNMLTVPALGVDSIELKNSHLNDKGFYFLQYALSKWEDRLYKDQGEEKEWLFLVKWYNTFLENNPDLN